MVKIWPCNRRPTAIPTKRVLLRATQSRVATLHPFLLHPVLRPNCVLDSPLGTSCLLYLSPTPNCVLNCSLRPTCVLDSSLTPSWLLDSSLKMTCVTDTSKVTTFVIDLFPKDDLCTCCITQTELCIWFVHKDDLFTWLSLRSSWLLNLIRSYGRLESFIWTTLCNWFVP